MAPLAADVPRPWKGCIKTAFERYEYERARHELMVTTHDDGVRRVMAGRIIVGRGGREREREEVMREGCRGLGNDKQIV